jgi:poly(3-hydroxybutyrate) depolymerase
MGRRKSAAISSDFFLVNVVYADGTQRSNRKVPQSQMRGLDDVADIRQVIEEQDQEIEKKSGQARGPIASITRVKKR